MAASEIGQRYQRILQMFWDPEPKNDEPGDPPIYLLGERYEARRDTKDSADSHDHGSSTPDMISQNRVHNFTTTEILPDCTWPREFVDDFESKLWFTYRNNFQPIPRSNDPEATAALTLSVRIRNISDQNGFTSDTGWGCMIRSGQCLIGNALSVLKLGRAWRRGTELEREKEIISLFADDVRAPFSIHKFVEHGAEYCGKHPGEWFGPSATAQCIRTLADRYENAGMKVLVTADTAQIYDEDIEQVAWKDGAFKPVLVLAGIRLGIERVTPIYREALKGLFALKQTIGIAGGRPSASHFFVGVQGNHFFYLDPHQTRNALPYYEHWSQYGEDEVALLHTRRLRRIHIDRMDPSMLLAFLIKDPDDLKDWKTRVKTLPGNPIFHLEEGPKPASTSNERLSALDEVEAFDDDEADEEKTDQMHKSNQPDNWLTAGNMETTKRSSDH